MAVWCKLLSCIAGCLPLSKGHLTSLMPGFCDVKHVNKPLTENLYCLVQMLFPWKVVFSSHHDLWKSE